jgi:sporulation protein YunB
MKRTRIKPSKAPIPSKYMFIISIFIFLGLSFQTFYYLEKNLEPVIREIARIRVEQLATKAVHEAIDRKAIQSTNFQQLVDIQKDKDGKIQAAIFNTNAHAQIIEETMTRVTHVLAEMGSISQKIPLGQALHSNLLAQFGPDIPLKLVPLGTVQVDLDTKMKEAGINMVLVTVVVVIDTKVKIVFPFSTQPALVKSEIPISSALVVGSVPQIFYNNAESGAGSSTSGQQLPSIVPPVQFNSGEAQK